MCLYLSSGAPASRLRRGRGVRLGGLGADEILHQRVDHGAHGHTQQHPHHAEGSAADGHRRQHPQPRQPHGFAHHAGIDQVSLHLLQDQQENEERQSLDGTLEHDKERAGGCADPRTENGDQRQRADDDRHRQCVGQPQQQHTETAERAEDERLRHLPGDEAGKGVVGKAQQMHEPVSHPLGQCAAQEAAGLGQERFLLRQQVQGEHESQQEIHQRAHDGGGDVQGGVHHTVALFGKEACDGVPHLVGTERHLRQGNAVLGGEAAEILPPRLHLRHVGGDVRHEGGAGLLQTGNQDKEYGEDNAHKQHHGQRQADGTLQLLPPRAAPLGEGAAPQPLQPRHHQIQHEGNADADKQGRQQPEQTAEDAAQPAEIVQPPVQQCRKSDQQHNALAVLFIQFQSEIASRWSYSKLVIF